MKIKFVDNKSRGEFFHLLKKEGNLNWRGLRKRYKISRSSFDRYKAGICLIPESLFLDFLKNFENNEKEEILKKTEKVQSNLGQVKGGKKNYRPVDLSL